MSATAEHLRRTVLPTLIVAAAYYATGRLGLALPYYGELVTLFWPPTGIALAGMYLVGLRVWPGVALGSLLVNLGQDFLLPGAILVAVGNTAGPAVGAWLLTQFAVVQPGTRMPNMSALLALGGLGAMAIPALVGTFTLCLAGKQTWLEFGNVSLVWWLGDSGGVLVAGPPFLAWTWHRGRQFVTQRFPEGPVWLIVAGAAAALAMELLPQTRGWGRDLAFVPLAVLFAVAWRRGAWEASLATLIVAVTAVTATSLGRGPFALANPREAMLLLWGYCGAGAFSTLAIGALQAERGGIAEDLIKTRREWDQLIRAWPDLFFRLAADATIVEYRAGCETDLYVPPSVFLGRKMTEVLPTPVAMQLRSGLESARRTGQVATVEYSLPLPHRVGYYEGRILALPEGEFLVLVRDVSERVAAQELLRASDTRFREFMDHCPAVAFIKDADGRYVYVNARWSHQFPGRTDWRGRTDADYWAPETAKMFRESDLRALHSDAPIELREASIGLNGEVRHWLVMKFRLTVDGRPAVGGFALDVTQQVRAEEDLRQVQKMEAVGQLASGVAHDFNNRLTVIQGYASHLTESAGPDHPWRGALLDVLDAAHKAAELTKQLLAFGRRQRLEPKVVALGAAVRETLKLLGRTLGDQVELRTEFSPETPPVLVDPTQLEQVVINLAVNARDAMPAGGTLTIAATPCRFETKAESGAVTSRLGAALVVRDTGVGMSPEVARRIFEPFYTTKDVGKGTGLGLATVYGIVTQSGGTIEVVSEPGAGTEFVVRWPAAEGVAAPAPVTPTPPRLARGTETILLVEDEPPVRTLFRAVLAECGYRVIDAENGMDAIERVATLSDTVDLLVTDVTMPRLGGVALASILRNSRPGLRVLFVSGDIDAAPQNAAPADAEFLAKPFTPADLASRVRRILDRTP